jgi:hypothetical protein
MTIDGEYLPRFQAKCERCAGRAGAASKIDQSGGLGARSLKLVRQLSYEQEVQRSVKEGEGRPLAITGKGRAFAEPLPPFHVRRRQSSERPRHFRKPQVGEVSRFEIAEPRR